MFTVFTPPTITNTIQVSKAKEGKECIQAVKIWNSSMNSLNMQPPKSCDTFVVLPPLTKTGTVIFGKNSDRPQNEVQEVVFIKGEKRGPKLKCTYITIDESIKPVNSVILSKPAWMWGAEMGANDKNVVIGNEAVWTNNNERDGDARHKRLLGMDLVRLGLERGSTADEALNVITSLLEQYGQGGPCSEQDDSHIYHNSFLIADTKEAWILETSGALWAAERVKNGYRNISNGLTITTEIDKHSEKLFEKSQAMGLWDGQCDFNFTKCFTSGGDNLRQQKGELLLKQLTANASFEVESMLKILRQKEYGICRGCDDTFPTQGSQVSSLSAAAVSVHWFTATPDPSISFFKPFIFAPNVIVAPHILSPATAKREHHLYTLHWDRVIKADNDEIKNRLADLEKSSFMEVETLIAKIESGQSNRDEAADLLNKCVEAEIKLYS